MENLNIPAWVGKALYAFGIAAILGSGTTLMQNSRDVAVLQADSKHVESTVEKRLDRIENKLDTLIQEGRPNGTRQ